MFSRNDRENLAVTLAMKCHEGNDLAESSVLNGISASLRYSPPLIVYRQSRPCKVCALLQNMVWCEIWDAAKANNITVGYYEDLARHSLHHPIRTRISMRQPRIPE
jgi:hypothetical protein